MENIYITPRGEVKSHFYVVSAVKQQTQPTALFRQQTWDTPSLKTALFWSQPQCCLLCWKYFCTCAWMSFRSTTIFYFLRRRLVTYAFIKLVKFIVNIFAVSIWFTRKHFIPQFRMDPNLQFSHHSFCQLIQQCKKIDQHSYNTTSWFFTQYFQTFLHRFNNLHGICVENRQTLKVLTLNICWKNTKKLKT